MINIMKLLEILLLLMTMMIFKATKVKSNFNKNFPREGGSLLKGE